MPKPKKQYQQEQTQPQTQAGPKPQPSGPSFEFYANIDPATGRPVGLYRRVAGDGMDTLLERWNVEAQAWEDHPGLMAATGIGGDTPYERITEAQAMALWEDMNGITGGDEENKAANESGDLSSQSGGADDTKNWYDKLPKVKGNAPIAPDGFVKTMERQEEVKRKVADGQAFGADEAGSDVAFWEDMLPPEIEKEMLDFIRNLSKKKKGEEPPKEEGRGGDFPFARRRGVNITMLHGDEEKDSEAVKANTSGNKDVHVRGHWRWTRNGRVWVREYYRGGKKGGQPTAYTSQLPKTTEGLRPVGSFLFDGGTYAVYYDAASSGDDLYLWHNESNQWVASASAFGYQSGQSMNDNEILEAFEETLKDAKNREAAMLKKSQMTLPGIEFDGQPIYSSAFVIDEDGQRKRIEGMLSPSGKQTINGIDYVMTSVFMWDADGDLPTAKILISRNDFEALVQNDKASATILANAYDYVTKLADADWGDSPEGMAGNLFEMGQYLADASYNFTDDELARFHKYAKAIGDVEELKEALEQIDWMNTDDFIGMLDALTDEPFGLNDSVKLDVVNIEAIPGQQTINVYLSDGENTGPLRNYNVSFAIRNDSTHIGLIDLSTTEGNGAGTEILQTIQFMATPSGVLTLEANIDVGGYAWAVMGFDFALRQQKRRFFEDFFTAVKEEYGDDIFDEDEKLEEMKRFYDLDYLTDIHSWDIATWKGPDDAHFGKSFLLGSGWSGVKFAFDDPVGETYFRKRLGSKCCRHTNNY